MEKTLIEEPTIDFLEFFDQISEEARKEKSHVPPINKIVYYWTRKPLVVGRAITLASTLNDIEIVRNLVGLSKDKRAYLQTPNIGMYKKKLGRDPSEIKVLDPFGGAGNLIFEAKRLGLDCTISDNNPVAFLLEKAVLEYPVKYGEKLAEDFEKYAKQVIQLTQKEIGEFYKDDFLVYLWVWCIKCPHCNQRTPLTNRMWIANSSRNKIGMRFHVTPDKNFRAEIIKNLSSEEGKKFTQKRGKAICISCKNTISYKELTNDIATRKDREMIAIQVRRNSRKDYVLASENDKKLFFDAAKLMEEKYTEFRKQDLIPEEEIRPSHQDTLSHYGIKYWNEYFSDRQLLILTTLLKNIKYICNNIQDKEYAKSIVLYLGFLLCKHVNANSFGAVWHVTYEKPEHALVLRRPSFVFNHLEINPFEKVQGSLYNIKKNIRLGIKFGIMNSSLPNIKNRSVTKLPPDKKYDLIITGLFFYNIIFF